MAKVRIAQIAPLMESVPPKRYGGTERVVHNLTRGLIAAGADVTVFCSGDSTTEGRVIPVFPKATRMNGKVFDPFAYQMKMLGAVAALAPEFDLIHNHYDYPMIALTRMTSTPVLTTMHNRLDFPPELPLAFEHFLDAPLISITRAQRKPLPYLNWVGTVYHGLDPGSFVFNPKPGKYLAFLGRFSRDKRPDWAIDIALRSGIPLKIAAKVDPTEKDYFENIIKRRIDGRFIEFIGEIGEHEKSEFLGNALALAFPIDWPEPFGLVMIEAMACGTPVLTRPVGSVPEIMTDGLTGFVREDIHELAALAQTLESFDRRGVRRCFEDRFSIERMTQEYLHVYRQLIRQPGQHHKRPHPAAA